MITGVIRRGLSGSSSKGVLYCCCSRPQSISLNPERVYSFCLPARLYTSSSDSSTPSETVESASNSEGFVVHLYGLPWTVSVDNIRKFLRDCSIEDGDSGVVLTTNPSGSPSGEAFVTLSSEEDLERALRHHREYIGSRYVEVSKSSWKQRDMYLSKSKQVSSDISETAVVRLRGVPYRCEKKQIEDFFSGMYILEPLYSWHPWELTRCPD